MPERGTREGSSAFGPEARSAVRHSDFHSTGAFNRRVPSMNCAYYWRRHRRRRYTHGGGLAITNGCSDTKAPLDVYVWTGSVDRVAVRVGIDGKGTPAENPLFRLCVCKCRFGCTIPRNAPRNSIPSVVESLSERVKGMIELLRSGRCRFHARGSDSCVAGTRHPTPLQLHSASTLSLLA